MAEHETASNESEPFRTTSLSLIENLRSNEPEAWKRLYELYEPLVRYWCRRANFSDQDIPDLVQDVFQTVARSIHGFSADRGSGSFRGWLKTITHSRCIDWHRRNQHKPRATGGSTAQFFLAAQPFADGPTNPEWESESVVEDQLTQQMYARALVIIRDHFQERTWQAFWRVVVEGQSPADVGRQLSMKPATVRVAKSRVLHRLRAELGELSD